MSGVPANIIIPFVGLEFDGSRSAIGPALVPVSLLVIGQRLSTGTVAANTKFKATNPSEVGLKAGFDSVCHRMAIKVFKNNKTVPVTFIGLDDAATSTAATYEFTLSGTATKVGELVCYVAGQRYGVGVQIGDVFGDVAAALAAAITADAGNIQVTAAAVGGVVTLTCVSKGIAAGDLDVRFNYNSGEAFPEGISVTTVTATAGTVDPDISDALAAIGGDWYNVICQPYVDNTNMNFLEEYLDEVAGPMEQRDGVAYQAKRATLAEMITFGEDTANRNNEWMVTLPAQNRMESTYEIAAGVAAETAVSIQDDPAVPLHRMHLSGFSVLDSNDKWTPTERNQLAHAGIATITDDNGVQTESTVSMYLKNSAGAADTAYQMQNTQFILSALRYRFVNAILTKYPRAKLADSIEGVGADQQFMTPDIGRTEAVAWFIDAQRDGLVEGGQDALNQFQDELIVARDETNKNRLNWLLPPDLMNQFIVGSGVVQFIG
jgi:phage tail sheath gpL-like